MFGSINYLTLTLCMTQIGNQGEIRLQLKTLIPRRLGRFGYRLTLPLMTTSCSDVESQILQSILDKSIVSILSKKYEDKLVNFVISGGNSCIEPVFLPFQYGFIRTCIYYHWYLWFDDGTEKCVYVPNGLGLCDSTSRDASTLTCV